MNHTRAGVNAEKAAVNGTGMLVAADGKIAAKVVMVCGMRGRVSLAATL